MTVLARARRIASNRDSGASELLVTLLPLLGDALAEGPDHTLEVARIVCRGQPSMAPLWKACAAAVAELRTSGRFAHVRAAMERAPRALVRAAGASLGDAFSGEPEPCVLTVSYSSSVAKTLGALAERIPLRVVCAEGRPRFEGRRLAVELAAAGASVTLATDAALTSFLRDSTAVIVGADAVCADHWINKVGTLGLAAGAALAGTPVYVVASRDKFVAPALESRLVLSSGLPEEVWAAPAAGVAVTNRYFESIPAELVTLILTDAGPIAPGDLPGAVAAQTTDSQALLDIL